MSVIYHFAKFGDLNSKPYGGGEVGNRRTMTMLREIGHKVVLIPRYCNYKKKSKFVYIDMILGDLWAVMKMFFKLLFESRKAAIVHISGFTGAYMSLECLSVVLAKFLGYEVTYEIRGGGIIGFYEEGSAFYKLMFKTAVRKADHVWSQGAENKELICSLSKATFFHYPNCVSHDFMPHELPNKITDPLKLVYLGRLCPVKHIEVIIESLSLLRKKGYNAVLDLVGDGVDFPEYVKRLHCLSSKLGMVNYCTFHGSLNKSEMTEILKDSVFFLFPSEEPREGQSNSLTETMSFGIIPIATSQGYNRSTIGCDDLICNQITSSAYCEKIESILMANKTEYYSKIMYKRVYNCYTYEKVINKVKEQYGN